MTKRPRGIDFLRPLTRIASWDDFNHLDAESTTSFFIHAAVQGHSSTAGNERSQTTGALPATQGEIPIIAAGQITASQSLKPAAASTPSAAAASQATKDSSSSNQTSAPNAAAPLISQIYKKRRLQQSSYLRLRQDQLWPLQDKYELADDDVVFLREFNEDHVLALSQSDTEILIEAFELRSGKDFIVNWIDIKAALPRNILASVPTDKLEAIYNYWRIKRDLLKRPLLRIHWKPNFNDKDPHVAFRPRVAEKMKLRRQTKQNEEEQFQKLTTMKEEMVKCQLLVSQIKARESLKAALLEQKSLSFVQELYKIDKNLSYTFVDDIFETAKEFEAKRQQTDEANSALLRQVASLNETFSKLNPNNALAVIASHAPHIKKHHHLRPTGYVSSHRKPDEENSELHHNVTNMTIIPSFKPQQQQQLPQQHNQKNILNRQKKINIEEINGSAHVLDQEYPLIPSIKIVQAPITASSSLVQLTVPMESDNLSKKSLKNQKKLLKIQQRQLVENNSNSPLLISVSKKEEAQTATSTTSQQAADITANDQYTIGDRKTLLACGDAPFDQVASNSLLPDDSVANSSWCTTPSYQLASFVASIFLDISKDEAMSLERLQQVDARQILSTREQLNQLISPPSTSLISQLLAKTLSASKQLSLIPNNNPLHPLLTSQSSQSQLFTQQQQQQFFSPQSTSQAAVDSRKRNVIHFKTRLRKTRSNLLVIDRLFDDKDNIRYEDICSKEGNYNPRKVVEKFLLLKASSSGSGSATNISCFNSANSAQIQRINGSISYSLANQNEIYKKNYFQQKLQRFSKVIEDHTLPLETAELLAATAASTAPASSASVFKTNATLPPPPLLPSFPSSSSLTNVYSSDILVEDATSTIASSNAAAIAIQTSSNDPENKQLKRQISQSLKDFLKKKQQQQLFTTVAAR